MTDASTNTLLELIERQGTLNQASAFLQERQLPHSAGSWHDMREKRLRVALEGGLLQKDDLFRLLSLAEEHGHQHVLAFRMANASDVEEVFDYDRTEQLLANSSSLPPIGQPSIVDMPSKKTVVEARFDAQPEALTFRIVEKRFRDRNAQRIRDEHGQLQIRYESVPYRAVHIVRILRDGAVEVRVYSSQEAIDYNIEAQELLKMVSAVVDPNSLEPMDFDRIREVIWDKDQRASIASKILLSHSEHRNSDGSKLRAASSRADKAIFEDADLTSSVDTFHDGCNDGYCEKASLYVLQAGSAGKLSRDVYVGLTDAANAFILSSKVTAEEFEYMKALIAGDFDSDVNDV